MYLSANGSNAATDGFLSHAIDRTEAGRFNLAEKAGAPARPDRILPFLAALVLSGLMIFQHGLARAALPELPRVFLDTTYAPPAGNTITVNAGGNLQSAINNAQPGDTIVLQAGATFTGPFSLPNKGTNTQWIYIRSSAYASLPAPGNRVTPNNVSAMATIVGTGAPVIAVQTLDGAHHYRFVGIEFKPGPGLFATALIRLGNASETSVSQFPHDIVIDRCYIHGDPTVGGRRGIALNSASSAVIDSYLSDWKDSNADSQALMGWSGPGPFKIVNNHLEGAGENVMFGGADPVIPNQVPSDIEIRGNHFFKPVAWRGTALVVKNLFELKISRRTLVEGNIFEYTWLAGQDFAINIKSVNQDGSSPWSLTEDVTFRYNIVRHAANAIKLCGISCDAYPSAQGGRYLIQNNLFDDINSVAWGGLGNFLQTGNATPDLVVNHNTVIHNGSTYASGGGSSTGFVFTDNIVQRGPFGFKGSGIGEGTPTLNALFPGFTFARNIVAGAPSTSYPPNNFFPATYDSVGFSSLIGGDYRLNAASPYKSAGTDGKDLGADIDAVNLATRCALGGQCGTPPPVVTINNFTFADQANVAPGATITSNAVSITGTNFTVPAAVNVVGGSYSVGCTGTFTATPGSISNNQSICVQHKAATALSTATTTTLAVGDKLAAFTSTTVSYVLNSGDDDGDGIPNAVEITEGLNAFVKDNDVFTNPRLFTMQQYRDFLRREGDPTGVTVWTNNLVSGNQTRATLVETFFNSAEFQGEFAPVARLYFAYFLRVPDYSGLDYWSTQVHEGYPLIVVADAFAASPEFQQAYGALSNSQFVTLVYQNVLGRSASPSEINYHVARLTAGASRGAVMLGFSESPEFQAKSKNDVYVTMMYAGMLRRSPDQAGFDFWVSYMNSGNSGLTLIAGFLASSEYRARFLPP